MTFFRTLKSIIHDYLVYNQTLSRVNQVDDLGFRLVPSLSYIILITSNTLHVKFYVLWVSLAVMRQILTNITVL